MSKTHMKLRTYLDTLPRGGIGELARLLGISGVYLHQLAVQLDGREPSPQLCRRIEHATDGSVRCWDMRGDWAEIWPELVGTDGAPAPAVCGQALRKAA